MEIGEHPPIPIGSSWQFLVQHVLLFLFVIVGYTLSRLFEALHIFQVDIGGLPHNPTVLFCNFSCHYIFLYFQGHFGALNNVFLACHGQNVDEVRFWQHNVYLLKIPFQRAVTCLKRRSHAKVTTPRSWGTNLPIGAHVASWVSSPRVRFLDV